MRTLSRLIPVVLAAGVVTGCTERLEVTNPNVPDRNRALARPVDVENFLGGAFNSIHGATLGAAENLNSSFAVMSFENFSNLANFNMGPRGAMPRNAVDNSRGNAGTAAMNGPWYGLSRAAKTSAVVLELMNNGLSLGSVGQDFRARSYAWFTIGLANGLLAASYDSVAVVLPGSPDTPPLEGYASAAPKAIAAMDSALRFLDSLETRAPSTVFPANWFNVSTGDQSIANVRRLMRSYRARTRVSIARNPTEANGVDWAAVRDDAANGITANLELTMNATAGWPMAWITQVYAGPNWHVMTPFIIGMSDTTGAFGNWLNTTITTRSAGNPNFVAVMRTYDNRFPAGDTRSAQQAAPGRYFINRTTDGDANDGAFGFSAYSLGRFAAFNAAGRVGPFPVFTIVENRMLQAEALMRLGQTGAGALINVSRTASGLSDVSAINGRNDPVGTVGNQCVPRVPASADGTTYTLSCPTLWEAMKWEKRMETMYTAYGSWFFDSRRWGDLPVATPLQFPVPWAEMDTRPGTVSWNGSEARDGAPTRGTYGY